jgi:hypothetical protein
MRSVTTRLGVLALLVAVTAGCGSGGKDFAKAARERCAQARTEAQKLGGAANAARLAEVLQRRNAIVRELIGDLSELEPPDEQQADVERMLGSYEQALGLQERVPGLLTDGDLAQARTLLEQAAAATKRGDSIARRLGLAACMQAEARLE